MTNNIENKWEDRDRSDVKVEKNKTSALRNATDCQLAKASVETQLIKTEGLGRGIPRTEESLQLKLAKKIPANIRPKIPARLYEILAPGSTALKDKDITYTIKQPRKMPVTVHKSDLAKFGKKTEIDTP